MMLNELTKRSKKGPYSDGKEVYIKLNLSFIQLFRTLIHSANILIVFLIFTLKKSFGIMRLQKECSILRSKVVDGFC
jgi:hypothetical protein